MRNSELELWNKIAAFQFDKSGVKLTFAKRLAKENALSEPFANEIIAEYRKFIFLCCVSKEQVSPSHFVDLAWHLHLTYTRSYWDDLCRNTIDRDLHHNPTEGGPEEDKKNKNLYKSTLDLYELYFSSKAPESVWPKENGRPKSEKGGFWLIPKPFSFRRQNFVPILAIVLSTLLLGCTSYTGSFSIVLGLVLLIGIIFLVARNNSRGGEGGSGCSSSGCSSIFGGDDSGNSGGDSGCSSGGCGGGGD